MHLYHGLELLTNQGLRCFFNYLSKDTEEEDRSKKRIRGELNKVPQYRDIMATLTNDQMKLTNFMPCLYTCDIVTFSTWHRAHQVKTLEQYAYQTNQPCSLKTTNPNHP